MMNRIDPDLLYRIGRSIWGPGWISKMSVELGINERTIRRWASGELEIPARLRTELRALVTDNLLKELDDQGQLSKDGGCDGGGSDDLVDD